MNWIKLKDGGFINLNNVNIIYLLVTEGISQIFYYGENKAIEEFETEEEAKQRIKYLENLLIDKGAKNDLD